jgi:hypothetical protein
VRVKQKEEELFICIHGNSGVYWADRLTALECLIDLQGLDRPQSCWGAVQEASADVFTAVPAECQDLCVM